MFSSYDAACDRPRRLRPRRWSEAGRMAACNAGLPPQVVARGSQPPHHYTNPLSLRQQGKVYA